MLKSNKQTKHSKKMKTQKKAEVQAKRAFTLIEMIGVLAVIAILAALLIPKIFEAINNARVNNAAVSYNTVKSGLADHYAKWGSILSSNGVTVAVGNEPNHFDKVLVSEGFLDKPFHVKIGDGVGNHVHVTNAVLISIAPDGANQAYDLDGSAGVNLNDAIGGAVVEAVITGVTELDAKDLNDRIDGVSLGTAVGTSDFVGRVKYTAGTPTTTVKIYVTHR